MSRQPYDAVLTDLRMENGDGVQVTQVVKSLQPQTQVIVITGKEENSEYMGKSEKLREVKPDGILQKPFTVDDIKYLIGQIQSILEKRKTQPDYQPEPSFYIRPATPTSQS